MVEPVRKGLRVYVDRQPVWQIILLIFTCVWGADYLIGPPKYSLHAVEKYMPLTAVGGLLLFFGVMGLVGELWMEIGRNKFGGRAGDAALEPPISNRKSLIFRAENRWWPSFFAHVILCGICIGLMAGCILEMVVKEHWWGGRMAAALFLIACLHFICAERRKRVA